MGFSIRHHFFLSFSYVLSMVSYRARLFYRSGGSSNRSFVSNQGWCLRYVCTHVLCMYMYVCMYMSICMTVSCMYICMYVCMYAYVHVCVYVSWHDMPQTTPNTKTTSKTKTASKTKTTSQRQMGTPIRHMAEQRTIMFVLRYCKSHNRLPPDKCGTVLRQCAYTSCKESDLRCLKANAYRTTQDSVAFRI